MYGETGPRPPGPHCGISAGYAPHPGCKSTGLHQSDCSRNPSIMRLDSAQQAHFVRVWHMQVVASFTGQVSHKEVLSSTERACGLVRRSPSTKHKSFVNMNLGIGPEESPKGKRKFGHKVISASLGNDLEGKSSPKVALKRVGRWTSSGRRRQHSSMESTCLGRNLLRGRLDVPGTSYTIGNNLTQSTPWAGNTACRTP